MLRKAIGILLLVVGLPVAFGIGHTFVGSWGRVGHLDDVPAGSTAVVLGARAFPTGPSDFLKARLDLAVQLVEAGKLERIIVSGDGRDVVHDEPATMRRYLEEQGVASSMIEEDPGGYDTYDTCWHARHTFGADEVVLLTQDYHVRRAVTICRALGVEATAVPDTSMVTTWPLNWIKAVIREPGAVLKMEWDLLSGRVAATRE